jgi:hypothetical protein
MSLQWHINNTQYRCNVFAVTYQQRPRTAAMSLQWHINNAHVLLQ